VDEAEWERERCRIQQDTNFLNKFESEMIVFGLLTIFIYQMGLLCHESNLFASLFQGLARNFYHEI
jgi:hypothetical protein